MSNLLKICLLGIAIAIVAMYVFKIPVSSMLFIGFLLVCPLMHVFMMHGDHGKTSKGSHH